mgnify:CR=1 FL=1
MLIKICYSASDSVILTARCPFKIPGMHLNFGIFSTTFIVNCQDNTFRVEASKYAFPDLTNCKSKKLMLHIPVDRIFLVNNE